MTTGMEMFGRVFVGRRITAVRFAAGLAGTQVYPMPTRFDTLDALMGFGRFDFVEWGHMLTRFFCHVWMVYSSTNLIIQEQIKHR
jgi:hypothetical protein